MTAVPDEDRLWHFLALLLVKGPKHVAIQLGIEPVLRDKKSPIEVSYHSYLFGLLEEFWLDRALGSLVTFLIKVINVNLSIHALQVDHRGLHCDLLSLLRVGLDGNLPNRELMGRVAFLRELLWFTFGAQLHLHHEARVVHPSLNLTRHLSEAVVLWHGVSNHTPELLVVSLQLGLLFCREKLL